MDEFGFGEALHARIIAQQCHQSAQADIGRAEGAALALRHRDGDLP
ncbi:hypothetical protein [Mycobacterium sp. UM_CSW]|nr:hypothetical protein [Mycobacterium sp. UM_CSW]